MNEIARFQRLSSVSLAASCFQDARRAPGRVGGASRETVERVVCGEPLGDALEQSGRVDAVVVGERDDVRAHVVERDVARARKPASRAQVNELERRVP